MSLLSFLRENGRLVTFGFFMCLCSSFGQTFFISLFNGELRRVFQLTHGDLGAMYAAGTIASAATLLFAGRLIDRIPLRYVAAGVLIGLAAAAAAMGLVWTAAGLPFVFFGLRLFGQGLASHTGMTTMGRYFDAARGRALALASLGYSAGEAAMPALVVASLSLLVWQSIWLLISGIVLLAIPFALLLLRGAHRHDEAAPLAAMSETPHKQWRLGEVLRDGGLWFRLPTLLAPAFIATGIFFHQVYIAHEKGWPLEVMAFSFTAFAVTSFLTTLLAGPLVDRFSARRLLPFVLAPLCVGCLLLASLSSLSTAPIMMMMIGVTTGLYGIAGAAIWPELYGVRHLGSIKAFAQSAMVLSSGLAPVLFGILIDRGVTIEMIVGACAALCVAAAILAALPNRRAVA